jgi:transposase
MEQLDYNLLFRWFVGLGIDDPVWDVTVFTKNRDRLLEGEIAARFLRAVLEQPKVKGLLSDEHFSVDGTLIQAPPAPPGAVSFGDRIERLLTLDGLR